MRVWLYYRLSRDEDVELNSLKNQRNILVDYVNHKGYEIVGESFDDNASGMHFNREGIDEICEVVEKKLIDAVVVKDLSRLGRQRTQTAVFIDFLGRNNVRVLSVTENIDTSNENDDLIVGFKGIINDLYARDISKKIRAGYLQKQKEGIVITTPMGYYKDRNTNEILIVQEEAEIIRRIFELYLSGYGMKSITRILNNEGVKSPQYYQNTKYKKSLPSIRPDVSKRYMWTSTTVKRILQNEFYIGTLVCHKCSTSKINHRREKVPAEEQFIYENFVPAIISKEKWEQVQYIIKQKSERQVRASAGTSCHRYTGLIECEDCGSVFVCKTRKHKDQSKRYEYICNGYHRYGKDVCSQHRIDEIVLDELIYDELIKLKYEVFEKCNDIEKDIERWRRRDGFTKNKLKELNSQLVIQREERKAIVLERLRDKKLEDIYSELLVDCENRIKRLERDIAMLMHYDMKMSKRKTEMKSVAEILEKILQEGEISDANIRLLVNKIIIKEQEGKLDIHIKLNIGINN